MLTVGSKTKTELDSPSNEHINKADTSNSVLPPWGRSVHWDRNTQLGAYRSAWPLYPVPHPPPAPLKPVPPPPPLTNQLPKRGKRQAPWKSCYFEQEQAAPFQVFSLFEGAATQHWGFDIKAGGSTCLGTQERPYRRGFLSVRRYKDRVSAPIWARA